METYRERTGSDLSPEEYFEFDTRAVAFHAPATGRFDAYHGNLPPGADIDEWGVARAPGDFQHLTRQYHPLQNAQGLSDIIGYPYPDYTAPEAHRHLAGETAAYHARGLAVLGALWVTVFETAWAVRGMTELLTDMMLQPALASALLDRITEIRCWQAGVLAGAGVDVLALGDDVATQRGMLLSPDLWRAWFKPRLRAVIEAARAVKPGLHIFYHSDGDCRAIIPDLIEIGVTTLNPIQPECMNPVQLKKDYGEQLAFWGTVGTQSTMPFGTPDEVRAVVRERVQTVGAGGGLLLAPTHILQPDVPWENVVAFVDAVKSQS
jgi:uroporphyrinogen decarboxylase